MSGRLRANRARTSTRAEAVDKRARAMSNACEMNRNLLPKDYRNLMLSLLGHGAITPSLLQQINRKCKYCLRLKNVVNKPCDLLFEFGRLSRVKLDSKTQHWRVDIYRENTQNKRTKRVKDLIFQTLRTFELLLNRLQRIEPVLNKYRG